MIQRDRRLRVLVVSLLYPPSALGGYEIMCSQVCEWLQQRGHDLLVLTSMRNDNSDERVGSVLVQRALRSYWDGKECLYPPLLEALELERHNQDVFQRTIAEFRPDVVSFWHMGDLSLGLITTAIRLELPMVFVIGDDWLCYGWWADGWLRRFRNHPRHAIEVERHTGIPTQLPNLGEAGMFCFVSDYTRRRAEELGGWHFSRFAITPPGIATSLFPPLVQAPERTWRWRLLWLGRVVKEKGVEVAIQALRYLPQEAELRIVGPVDAAYRSYIEEMATEIGALERISFALAARQEVRAYYQDADVTLFTSIIEHEAFGMVPLEAMASGCPVVSSGIGGAGEYCIDGVNCVRVVPGDVEELAGAIRRLTDDAGLRRSVVEGGLQTARRLTLDRQAQRIEEWLLKE